MCKTKLIFNNTIMHNFIQKCFNFKLIAFNIMRNNLTVNYKKIIYII